MLLLDSFSKQTKIKNSCTNMGFKHYGKECTHNGYCPAFPQLNCLLCEFKSSKKIDKQLVYRTTFLFKSLPSKDLHILYLYFKDQSDSAKVSHQTLALTTTFPVLLATIINQSDIYADSLTAWVAKTLNLTPYLATLYALIPPAFICVGFVYFLKDIIYDNLDASRRFSKFCLTIVEHEQADRSKHSN